MKSCIKPFQKRSGNNNLRILHYSDFSGHIIRYIVIKALLINMKLEMQFWDQVSLLSLLMLTEYVFIKTCVLFLCFCEGAFLHAMSCDTRLSALLVSRKRKIWVATSPTDENPRGMSAGEQVCTQAGGRLAPSAGTDRGHVQGLLLLEDSAMCMGTGKLKGSRTA